MNKIGEREGVSERYPANKKERNGGGVREKERETNIRGQNVREGRKREHQRDWGTDAETEQETDSDRD